MVTASKKEAAVTTHVKNLVSVWRVHLPQAAFLKPAACWPQSFKWIQIKTIKCLLWPLCPLLYVTILLLSSGHDTFGQAQIWWPRRDEGCFVMPSLVPVLRSGSRRCFSDSVVGTLPKLEAYSIGMSTTPDLHPHHLESTFDTRFAYVKCHQATILFQRSYN